MAGQRQESDGLGLCKNGITPEPGDHEPHAQIENDRLAVQASRQTELSTIQNQSKKDKQDDVDDQDCPPKIPGSGLNRLHP